MHIFAVHQFLVQSRQRVMDLELWSLIRLPWFGMSAYPIVKFISNKIDSSSSISACYTRYWEGSPNLIGYGCAVAPFTQTVYTTNNAGGSATLVYSFGENQNTGGTNRQFRCRS
jgi:hypothetical protein